jgi:hypothetical protein
LIGALLLYASCLALPTFECGGDRPFFRLPLSDDPLGIIYLGLGWLGLLVYEPRWFANIFFFMMVFEYFWESKPKRWFYPAIVFVTAISCLFIPARACGHEYKFSQSLAIGGYIWVVAVISVAAIYTLQLWRESTQMTNPSIEGR